MGEGVQESMNGHTHAVQHEEKNGGMPDMQQVQQQQPEVKREEPDDEEKPASRPVEQPAGAGPIKDEDTATPAVKSGQPAEQEPIKHETSTASQQQPTSLEVLDPSLQEAKQDDAVKPVTDPQRIQAYARLEFPFFNFYIQKLSITIGRRPPAPRNANNNAKNGSSSEQPPQATSEGGAGEVSAAPANGGVVPPGTADVDLGNIKAVSRDHARLFFNALQGGWSLEVHGRNGLVVDGKWRARDEVVRLNNGARIQIAERIFHFVMPDGVPYPVVHSEEEEEDEEEDEESGEDLVYGSDSDELRGSDDEKAAAQAQMGASYSAMNLNAQQQQQHLSQGDVFSASGSAGPSKHGNNNERSGSNNNDNGYSSSSADDDEDDRQSHDSSGNRLPSMTPSQPGSQNFDVIDPLTGATKKRKRGRPPKVRTAEQLAEIERRNDPTIPRRPRGRPPKHNKPGVEGSPPSEEKVSKRQLAEMKREAKQREKDEKERIRLLEKEQREQARLAKIREKEELARKKVEQAAQAAREREKEKIERERQAEEKRIEKEKLHKEKVKIARERQAERAKLVEEMRRKAAEEAANNPNPTADGAAAASGNIPVEQPTPPVQYASNSIPVPSPAAPSASPSVSASTTAPTAVAPRPTPTPSTSATKLTTAKTASTPAKPPPQAARSTSLSNGTSKPAPPPPAAVLHITNQFMGKPDKPPYSYAALIAQAIYATQKKQASLAHIHHWLADKYPFFKENVQILQSAVKQTLAVNRTFLNIPNQPPLWALDPEQAKLFDGNTFLQPPSDSFTPSLHLPSPAPVPILPAPPAQAKTKATAAAQTSPNVAMATKKTGVSTAPRPAAAMSPVPIQPAVSHTSASPAPSKPSTTTKAAIPILIATPPSSYTKPAEPSSSNPSSMLDPAGYLPITLHDNKIYLSPSIFSTLTVQQHQNLQSIETKQALTILQAFVVNYFKQELKKRKKAEKERLKALGGAGAEKVAGVKRSTPSAEPAAAVGDQNAANKVQKVS